MSAVFYYDLNSPYAYLAAERIDTLLPAVWQPIVFGPLIVRLGKTPWSLRPGEREAGMAEVERRAAARGLPPVRWPDGWPAENYSLAAPRAALFFEDGRDRRVFSRELFRLTFVEGLQLTETVVVDAADALGLDGSLLRSALASEQLKDGLRAATDAADARGVTGIPTVALGDELFWGDDRLEDAARALTP